MIGVRLIAEDGETVTVWNGYFPQGENVTHPTKFPHKERFYGQLARLLNEQHRPDERLAIMGDFNISPEDQDIGIGEANRKRWLREGKTSFQPIEREWLEGIKAWGLAIATDSATQTAMSALAGSTTAQKGLIRSPSAACVSTIFLSPRR
ncbi:hypothetical protein HORIV_27760 [Vreelandella olivaria]|uniref:Endonuclease/exonuclease/phosphatase domain-containing protein n=1 Tax=Vreelandella olivaria TaxID=390919 RepID=A0ABM7GID6_9GAMM|nr:hypothetical protein HORIV_27760 [Halomonas olivaria]